MRKKFLISLVVLFLVLVSGFLNIFKDNSVEKETENIPIIEEHKVEESGITVYVYGAVNHPGILKIPEGSKFADAIDKSGGALMTADLSKVDMNEVLNDGQQINVPDKPLKIINGEGFIGGGEGKININTALEKELDKLPGVGPALAQAIVDYRTNNGDFKSLEDLKKVKGIGESKYKKIEPCIEL